MVGDIQYCIGCTGDLDTDYRCVDCGLQNSPQRKVTPRNYETRSRHKFETEILGTFPEALKDATEGDRR